MEPPFLDRFSRGLLNKVSAGFAVPLNRTPVGLFLLSHFHPIALPGETKDFLLT
jgi:hypothetical protein